jgi:Ca2+-binding EF-hand superfamily protein
MLIAEELELQHERRENAAELFHAFLERLTLDQRRELAQRLMRWPPGPGNGRERGMGRGGGRLGLRAFDLDDDGRLDESELEAARSAMTQRWERHRERRERELRRRFDADADGELNPEERASMEDAEARRRQAIEFRLHQMLLERFDTDGDGVLSEEELRPIIDWLGDPPPPPPPGFEFELPEERPGWRGRGPRGEDRRDRWWDRRSGGAGPGDRRDRDADRDDASGGTDATDL